MLGADIRTGIRSLLKTPLLTAAALISLGLSISSTSVVFGVVNALILKPLPFPEPDRILLFWQSHLDSPSDLDDTAPANFADWRRESNSFAHLAAYAGTTYDLTEGGPPAEIVGTRVTPGFFDSLGIRPRPGRDFTEEEATGQGAKVAIISHSLWVRRFGASSDVLGKRIMLGSAPYLIVGVMPDGWYLVGNTDVWTPLSWEPSDLKRDDHYLSVVGRLRPGISIGAAQGEISSIAQQLASNYPEADSGYGITLKRVGDVFPAQRDKRLMTILMGIVAFVLLIACANISNLQLAKASGRSLEIATRSALGASRAALMRQQLVESLLLSLAGGVIAVALTGLELHLLKVNFTLSDSWTQIGLNLSVFFFTFAIATLAGVISGLAPSLRSSKPDLNQMLQQGGRSESRGRSFWFLGRILVSAEVMLAVGLLSVGGDMIVSFLTLRNLSPGFDSSHLLTARLSLPAARYGAGQFSEKQQVTRTLDNIADHISSIPGVRAAAYTTVLPRSESDPKTHFYRADQRTLQGGEAPIASWRAVSANYFDVLKIPLLEGRGFSRQDLFSNEPVVVVSKSLAERFFPGQSAVGQQILLFDDPRVIVGVVGNVLLNRSDTAPPCIYLPHNQSPRLGVSFVIRTQGDPIALAGTLPPKVWEVDSQLPVSRVVSFDEYEDLQFSGRRLTVHLLVTFCLLAIVLATIGLYGLVSYTVSERSCDFAIRMALGARRDNIFKLVMVEAAMATIPGTIAGFLAVLFARQVLSAYFDGILQNGWLFTLAVSVLLSLTVALASMLPAARASSTDLAILRQ